MGRLGLFVIAVAALVGVFAVANPSSPPAGDAAGAIDEGKLPAGYCDWRLISVAREEGELDDVRSVLGNDAAIDAYRQNTRLSDSPTE